MSTITITITITDDHGGSITLPCPPGMHSMAAINDFAERFGLDLDGDYKPDATAGAEPENKPTTKDEETPAKQKRATTKRAKTSSAKPSGAAAQILTGLAEDGPYTGSARELGEAYGSGTSGALSQMVYLLIREGAVIKSGPRGRSTYTITPAGLARINSTLPAPALPKPEQERPAPTLAAVENLDDDVDDLAWATEAL